MRVQQVACEHCKTRTDDVAMSKGWIELSAGGRGGCTDMQIIRYTGEHRSGRSRQQWEPMHFCSTKCLSAYVEAL